MAGVKVWSRFGGVTVAVTLAVGGAAGCQGSTPTGSPATTGPAASAGAGPAPTTAAPTTAAAGATRPSPTAAPVLPDGRSPAYLTNLDPAGKTVTFDLIE